MVDLDCCNIYMYLDWLFIELRFNIQVNNILLMLELLPEG